jgi:hypothetical protein
MYNFALGAGAVLAFVMIIAAGISIVQSQGNPSKVNEAKQKIINCLIGLTVLLTSYILLTTINPGIITIQNINLGNSGITVPVVTPGTTLKNIANYQFYEIPIGTITEGILAGTSSASNALPCYEYEHRIYDSNGNVIVGNTIDKNNDGVINEKDVLLNKDNFYCMKLLDDAIKQKMEVHLPSLLSDGSKQLDDLMKSGCECKRAYHQSYVPFYPDSGLVYPTGGECNCDATKSYCKNCGGSNGCTNLGIVGASEGGSGPFNFYTLVAGFKQYQYDVCKNRPAINCKRQEIKQLMDGTKPEAGCYSEEMGDNKLKEAPFNILNIKEAINRLDAFKNYYDKQADALGSARARMKDPYGERLTLSEVYNNVETRSDVSVIKNSFDNYNISRYCKASNCVGGVCTLNKEKRVCKMDGTQEYYTYAGDAATFYYSNKYNTDYTQENQVLDQINNTCSIADRNMQNEDYGGLIRIGEVVDYTEEWAREVSKRIDKVKIEVQGMYDAGIAIYNLPEGCNSGNCTNTSENKNNQCSRPACGCNGDCCCSSVWIIDCKEPEPTEPVCLVAKGDGACLIFASDSYRGCVYYCSPDEHPPVIKVQKDYWTCPYKSFYTFLKEIYQERIIDNSCYEETADVAETTLRSKDMDQIGHLQKMKERELMLFELASVGEIIDDNKYGTVPKIDLFKTILSDATYLIPDNYEDIKCDEKLSSTSSIKNRFTLFDMLNTARERLNGCVSGYSIPYKENDTARVISCLELTKTNLNILPSMPYVDNSKQNKNSYFDCYPYNRSDLTVDERQKCFDNTVVTGDVANPGCLMITKNYMDNYYCCK